jgi:hypothetical protein
LVLQQVSLEAQQLDQIGKKGGIKTSGGISINQVYKDPVYAGENPYSLVATGNLSTSFYGLSVPLTFTWSNHNWTYTQPFNQFTLSPSYKWATLHLGYSSMSFSPYSLSGHTFAGVGVELNPESKFKFSAMYGQLRRGAAGDSIHGLEPQYERYGTGMNAQYTFAKGEVGINLFYAKDNLRKPVEYMDSLGITPLENLIVGTHLGLSVLKSLRLTSDVSHSLLSNDRRLSKATAPGGQATRNYWALKSNIDYSTPLGSIGVGIEYVEPGYNSLGSYYMLNDFVNYTLNVATSLLKGRVTVAANTGLRQNNLSGDSDDTQKDVINNIAVGFNPNDKLNFNLSYSNFMNYSYIRTVFDEVNTHTEYELMDTLNFTQINENINFSAMWRVHETETVKHGISANAGYQQATQTQSDVPGNAGSRFVNGSGGYQLGLPKVGFSSGLNFNYSRTSADSIVSQALGPMLFVRKTMFDKKVQTNLSVSWNGTRSDGKNIGQVFTARSSLGYTLKKVHQFNVSLVYTQRESPTRHTNGFTAMLGYSFRFDYPKEKKEEGM